ncbi:hypothetical protein KL864_25480 [Mycolicibacterium goodii]|uniref:hypothetical protein n=1 Tax=Mycolicibacterium goodii TaxID=134601 RepID=UPI001BDDA7BD|nr:hypothetical protein [Mycolicibacterium goodii]MBU8819250.1 hypothetical protein [Mycolicibacterium goodii]
MNHHDMHGCSEQDITSSDEAAQRARKDRRTRDRLAKHIDVLDDLDVGVELPVRPHIGDVAAFYHVHRARIRALLLSHRDELLTDGWMPDDPQRPGYDLWTLRAVVRAGLLLDSEIDDDALHLERSHATPSPVAAQVRYLLGCSSSSLPVVYSTRAHRVKQCARLFENAQRIAEHIQGAGSPATLWAELQETERYELQALVVTLAALVPLDRPDLTAWLKTIGGGSSAGHTVARGLARLIPEPNNIYRRRQDGPRRRRNQREHSAVSGA